MTIYLTISLNATKNDIYKIINTLDENKSTGNDKIRSKGIKFLECKITSIFVELLLLLYWINLYYFYICWRINLSLKTRKFPEALPNSNRPISQVWAASKFWELSFFSYIFVSRHSIHHPILSILDKIIERFIADKMNIWKKII